MSRPSDPRYRPGDDLDPDSHTDSRIEDLAARARERDIEARALERRIAPPRADLRDDIFAALDAQAASEARASRPPAKPRSGARVIALRRFAMAAPLAAAAAFALFMGLSRGDGAPAAEYAVAIAGQVESERAPSAIEATTLQARHGAILEVVLRPKQAVAMPVDARVLGVFARSVDPIDVPVEVTDRGVLRFTVRGDALRGAREARIVVAAKSRIERALESARATPVPRIDGVTVVTIPIDAHDAP